MTNAKITGTFNKTYVLPPFNLVYTCIIIARFKESSIFYVRELSWIFLYRKKPHHEDELLSSNNSVIYIMGQVIESIVNHRHGGIFLN